MEIDKADAMHDGGPGLVKPALLARDLAVV
jgi:hypothetical protein